MRLEDQGDVVTTFYPETLRHDLLMLRVAQYLCWENELVTSWRELNEFMAKFQEAADNFFRQFGEVFNKQKFPIDLN